MPLCSYAKDGYQIDNKSMNKFYKIKKRRFITMWEYYAYSFQQNH